MASQVGVGEVAIVPTLKGFRRTVRREVEGTEKESSAAMKRGFAKAGDESGSAAGRGFKRSFTTNAKGTADATLKQLTADVAKASREVSNARLQEQNAAGKVRIAEAQLAEARKKHAADSSQVVRAEERLASANRTLEAAQDRTRESSDRLAEAQKKVADASDEAASRTSRGWQNVRSALSSVGDGIRSALSGAMEGVKRVASDAATFVTTQFKVAGAAIAATLGVALGGGFNRLKSIETATARMRGLGFAAEDVAAAMDIANNAAMGTAFGMDELAGAAAMAMTNGIKPGKELIKYLDTIKGAATASGASVAEIGSILGKVVQSTGSGGSITTEIQQMAERQIPIWQKLSEVMGVPITEVKKLSSEGKISMEQFQDAVLSATGGMAASMNDTMGASFTNMRAALSRFGVALIGSRLEGDKVVGGLYPLFKTFFDMVKEGINTATAAIAPFMATVTDAFANKIGPVMERATETFQKLTAAFKEGGGLELPGLSSLTGYLAVLAPIIGGLLGALGPLLARIPLIGAMFGGITAPLGIAVGLFAALFAFDADTLASGFDSLTASLPAMLTDIIGAVVGMLQTLVPKLVATLAANVPVLINGAVTLLLSLVDAVLLVAPDLLSAIVGLIPVIVTALIGMIPTLLQAGLTLFSGLLTAIVKLVPMLVGAIVELLPPLLTTLMSMLPSVITAALELFLGIVTGLVEAIPVLISAVLDLLPLLIDSLIGMIPTLIVTSVELFLALVLGLVKAIPDLLIALVHMLPQIVATLIGMIPVLLLAGVDLFMALVEAIPEMVPLLLAALMDMGPQIVDEVLKIGPKLMNAGKALIDKLIEGVKSMLGKIKDTFGGVMEFIGGFFPSSPAKRGPFSGAGWTRIGRGGGSVMEQFIAGVEGARRDLRMPEITSAGSSAGSSATAAGSSTIEAGIHIGTVIARDEEELVRKLERLRRSAYQRTGALLKVR